MAEKGMAGLCLFGIVNKPALRLQVQRRFMEQQAGGIHTLPQLREVAVEISPAEALP